MTGLPSIKSTLLTRTFTRFSTHPNHLKRDSTIFSTIGSTPTFSLIHSFLNLSCLVCRLTQNRHYRPCSLNQSPPQKKGQKELGKSLSSQQSKALYSWSPHTPHNGGSISLQLVTDGSCIANQQYPNSIYSCSNKLTVSLTESESA